VTRLPRAEALARNRSVLIDCGLSGAAAEPLCQNRAIATGKHRPSSVLTDNLPPAMFADGDTWPSG